MQAGPTTTCLHLLLDAQSSSWASGSVQSFESTVDALIFFANAMLAAPTQTTICFWCLTDSEWYLSCLPDTRRCACAHV